MDANEHFSIPVADSRTRSVPGRSAPWRETLLRFEVPFVWLSPGESPMASAAARSLFRRAYFDERVPDEVQRLGAQALHAPDAGSELLRNVSTGDGRFDLAIYVPIEAPESRVVLVTVRAAAWGTSPLVNGTLTRREAEVARLIASGRPTKQIAGCLSISTHTARHHTERVFEKLGVRTRSAVAALVAGQDELFEGRVARRA